MTHTNAARRAACVVAGLLAVSLSAPVAMAEPLTRDSLVEALRDKPLTRGLSGQKPAVSARQRVLIEQLAKKPTRAITVEERKTLVSIVKETKRPSIDLEIYFDFNSAVIRPKSMPTMIKLGQALSHPTFQGTTFLVAGHTDAKGTDDYNLVLSQDRAKAVKDFLVSNFGLTGTKLMAVGYGEEELKLPTQPEAGENRRVQITNLVP